jgi:ubiquinone/menaquinone biosynthesis C-methylase UbiE
MSDTQSSAANPANDTETPRDHHVCPPWIGRLLVSPIRRLVENPSKILAPLVTEGDIVVEAGSAMGFHSLDLARLVGPTGRVICLDIQQAMLDGLARRARRKSLDAIIEPRLCTQEDLNLADLTGQVDLVTAFNVVHETSRPASFLRGCSDALQNGGRLFITEPRGHVSTDEFNETIGFAASLGLEQHQAPSVWRSRTALFSKP